MTFSLLGRCARTAAFGVTIASSSPAVASRCAYVRPGAGAATTQNVTDPRLGPALLDQLATRTPARQAMDAVCRTSQHLAFRQLAVLDAQGRTAVFTGSNALGVHGSAAGTDCVAAGNLLASLEVLDAAVHAFAADPDAPLEDRLLAGLEAGLAHGGEAGPLHSAGLLGCDAVPWPVTDLRVDWSQDPVHDLRALWQIWAPHKTDYITRALDPSSAPGYGVPGDDR